MKKMKKIAVLFGALALLLCLQAVAIAADKAATSDIPEKNGVYDVPGHPNLKVRVFVHYPKKDVKQLAWPACTADPTSSYVVDPAGWHLPDGAWDYVINTANVPASVGSKNFPTIASNAFSQWANSQNNVTFENSGSTKVSAKKYDGKNLVTFGRASGSALAVTYTWYYTATGEAAETDTILNLKFPWFWNQCNANAYDAQGILTHELGHWMGLDDEYESQYLPNTMYGVGYKGDTKDMTLTRGDILGVQNIY